MCYNRKMEIFSATYGACSISRSTGCTVRFRRTPTSGKRSYRYRQSRGPLTATAISLLSTKTPLKLNFFLLALVGFVQGSQELWIIEGQPVGVAGAEAVGTIPALEVEQMEAAKPLDCFRYTACRTYAGEPHDAPEADPCCPGLAVDERPEHNQNRPLAGRERRPETAAGEPLKD